VPGTGSFIFASLVIAAAVMMMMVMVLVSAATAALNGAGYQRAGGIGLSDTFQGTCGPVDNLQA